MANLPENNAKPAFVETDPQPLAMSNLFRTLNTTRRQASLYGSDHPSFKQAIDGLMTVVSEFLECFGASTFIITEDAVILNDHWFQPCSDSNELYCRLRSRGAMAFTLVGQVSGEQMLQFLLYLNAEPQEIRREGGSNAYLRKHGVTKVVATDAVYSVEDTEVSEWTDMPNMDRAIAAALTWLSNRDEQPDLPRFRMADLFANPESAARLIREAVTKLHAANRSKPPSELADTVVNDLKDLAATNHAAWDESTPKIRKAISKLPREMRPLLGGFASGDQDVEDATSSAADRTADAAEVEMAVSEFIEMAQRFGEEQAKVALPDIDRLFGAKGSGLLSNWKTELQPVTMMKSSTHTLSTLMAWETNSAQHCEMSRSQAALIVSYIESEEPQLAMESAASLVEEVRRPDEPPWRAINARTALQMVELNDLKNLVMRSLRDGDQRSQEIAVSLVEILPDLAMAVLEDLESRPGEDLMKHLKMGIAASGRTAGPALGQMLTSGSPAKRWIALEILTSIETDWALLEVDTALASTDPEFLVGALEAISHVRSPLTMRTCKANLKHRSPLVRCAAMSALGSMGDPSVIPELVHIASRGVYRAHHLDEKIAAVRAIGKLGEPGLINWLEQVSDSHSFFWREKYQALRTAAVLAIETIRAEPDDYRKAA